MVDAGRGLLRDGCTGPEGDTQSRHAQHPDGVGAVADGHGVGRGQAAGAGQAFKRPLLTVAIDDRFDDAPREPAVVDLQPVALFGVEPGQRRDAAGEIREPAGH